MIRGSFACALRSTIPVVLFGLLLLGWLNMLKKSAVNRRLTDSVKWKFLNTEASEFQFLGPMKNARAFQFTVSVIGVRRTVPFERGHREAIVECRSERLEHPRISIDGHQGR